MKYIRNGIIYDSPITVEVEGYVIELTDEQISILGYMPLDVVSTNVDMEISDRTYTKNVTLNDIYGFSEPEETIESSWNSIKLPFVVGKQWKPVIENGKVTYATVDDEDGFGTINNPIIYSNGVRLLDGGVYTNGYNLYSYSGPNGHSNMDDIADVQGMAIIMGNYK